MVVQAEQDTHVVSTDTAGNALEQECANTVQTIHRTCHILLLLSVSVDTEQLKVERLASWQPDGHTQTSV